MISRKKERKDERKKERPQGMSVNVSNIFRIANNYKHDIPTLLHYEHTPVLSETIMIIIVTFNITIIIGKPTQNITSFCSTCP